MLRRQLEPELRVQLISIARTGEARWFLRLGYPRPDLGDYLRTPEIVEWQPRRTGRRRPRRQDLRAPTLASVKAAHGRATGGGLIHDVVLSDAAVESLGCTSGGTSHIARLGRVGRH